MRDESLRMVLTKVIELLNHTNIPQEDKVELMLNFMEFLDTKKYRKNIEKLNRK